MVDPGCSGGGFDDVQDLHEQRVVVVLGILGRATVDERTENNTAKGAAAQSAKVGVEPAKVAGGRHGM